jgi:hypothetical protein
MVRLAVSLPCQKNSGKDGQPTSARSDIAARSYLLNCRLLLTTISGTPL